MKNKILLDYSVGYFHPMNVLFLTSIESNLKTAEFMETGKTAAAIFFFRLQSISLKY